MRFQFVFGLASVLLELMAGPMFAQTAGAQYELGLSALKKGDLDGAITHVRRAVAIQPEYPEAHNTLGLLLGKKGKYEGQPRRCVVRVKGQKIIGSTCRSSV